MSYSYIRPRTKTIFTKEFQLLITFFSVTIFMLFSTYLFLTFRDYRFNQDKIDIYSQKEEFILSISNINEQIKTIEKQALFSEKIFTKNSVLKDSINNLFDLVPNKIILSEAKIMEKGLILYGITPNKDVYNFMLQAPLRSIFHRTYSSFYPTDNGWLNFVSTNYIEDEEELVNEN